ncbi:MAG: hypothetical protein RL318_1601 [Fibrobacterota bacterium]|jgi:hypothetical protein
MNLILVAILLLKTSLSCGSYRPDPLSPYLKEAFCVRNPHKDQPSCEALCQRLEEIPPVGKARTLRNEIDSLRWRLIFTESHRNSVLRDSITAAKDRLRARAQRLDAFDLDNFDLITMIRLLWFASGALFLLGIRLQRKSEMPED